MLSLVLMSKEDIKKTRFMFLAQCLCVAQITLITVRVRQVQLITVVSKITRFSESKTNAT